MLYMYREAQNTAGSKYWNTKYFTTSDQVPRGLVAKNNDGPKAHALQILPPPTNNKIMTGPRPNR